MKNKIKTASIVLLAITIGISLTIATQEYIKLYDGLVKAEPLEENSGGSDKEVAPAPETISIVDKIYILESSGGKYDSCVDNGLGVNGFGYGIYEDKMTCFKSSQEARNAVLGWFKGKLGTMTPEQAICLYQSGTASNSCEYLSKYNEL